jgi:hypothetical protein
VFSFDDFIIADFCLGNRKRQETKEKKMVEQSDKFVEREKSACRELMLIFVEFRAILIFIESGQSLAKIKVCHF